MFVTPPALAGLEANLVPSYGCLCVQSFKIFQISLYHLFQALQFVIKHII